MPISVDPATYVITIPKADTTFVGTNAATGYEIRSYDEYALMRELADYLDSEAGIGLPVAFTHATQVTISGIVYARSLLFLAPYTITFETGAYQVKLNGGTNNNMLDVLNPNNMSVIAANSAGLQTVATGGSSGPTAAETAAAVWGATTRTLSALGITQEQIATAVLAAMNAAPPDVNMVKVKGQTVNGAGTESDPWGP